MEFGKKKQIRKETNIEKVILIKKNIYITHISGGYSITF